MSTVRFSYSQIHQLCEDLAEKIEQSNLQPQLIIGVVRGGAIPAVILSHLLGVPCEMLNYSSLEGKGDDKNHSNLIPEHLYGHAEVLLVDDICDSGATLAELSELFLAKGNVVHTATLAYKDKDDSLHTPDFIGATYKHDFWLVFPWEH